MVVLGGCAVPDFRPTYSKLSQLRLDAARMHSSLPAEDIELKEARGSPAEHGIAWALQHQWRSEHLGLATPEEGMHVYGSITGKFLNLSFCDCNYQIACHLCLHLSWALRKGQQQGCMCTAAS
jgi:hypothetical protein